MDRKTFSALATDLQPALSRFVRRYLRSEEDADEIVQETFLRAWAQLDRFTEGTNFAAWVMTIARFLCMARLQDARRHPPPGTLDGREPAPPLPERLERLRAACERLPLSQREIVGMRFFDGLDYRSIAQITGESEVTLRSRIHDAVERLRSVLGPSLQD